MGQFEVWGFLDPLCSIVPTALGLSIMVTDMTNPQRCVRIELSADEVERFARLIRSAQGGYVVADQAHMIDPTQTQNGGR